MLNAVRRHNSSWLAIFKPTGLTNRGGAKKKDSQSKFMSQIQRVLLLDDDQDLLELYKEILSRLPSKPEIRTASSGARAIALLDSEPFTLLISDLNMPKMDGLQVLTIVRKKFPHLRTAVMTSVVDEQFRTRAYAMGIDLFLEKPNTNQEINFFLDCIESLLGQQASGGFRGVQSKSLVDIIQLECLSQGSSVLKITHDVLEGRIWILNGEIIDAEAPETKGDMAFQKILSWQTGNFEILPAEPDRSRQIYGSYQGLLLESAHAWDEEEASIESGETTPTSPLAALSRLNGVEFVLAVNPEETPKFESHGLENADRIATWVESTMARFRSLGESLQTGPINQLDAIGPQNHLVISPVKKTDLCVGFGRSMSNDMVHETMKTVLTKWAS